MSHFIKTTKGGNIAIYLSIHLSVGGKDFFPQKHLSDEVNNNMLLKLKTLSGLEKQEVFNQEYFRRA